jgi:HAD superfamily hydrolase (TIGR01509 family)
VQDLFELEPLLNEEALWSASRPQPLLAVVFDMDGLMLDTEVLARRAWQQAARELGCQLSDTQYLQLVGRRNDECERELSGWFGASFEVDRFRARCHVLWQKLTTDGVPTKPGLLELLDWVEGQGLQVAVATSTYAANAARSLSKAGLANRIPIIVSGDQVRASKPAPDIYSEAARRLQVSPSCCVAIEDSDPGIAAAHAAGMRAVMVPDLKPPSADSSAVAWRVCETLHDVRELLAADLMGDRVES